MLFKAYGAAQDETVFKFANDVQADQAVEIDVMKNMARCALLLPLSPLKK